MGHEHVSDGGVVLTDVSPHGLEGNSSLRVVLDYAGDIDIV